MQAHEWNAKYPPGTKVRFWTDPRCQGKGLESTTKTAAQLVSGRAIIYVSSYLYPLPLCQVKPLEKNEGFESYEGINQPWAAYDRKDEPAKPPKA